MERHPLVYERPRHLWLSIIGIVVAFVIVCAVFIPMLDGAGSDGGCMNGDFSSGQSC